MAEKEEKDDEDQNLGDNQISLLKIVQKNTKSDKYVI